MANELDATWADVLFPELWSTEVLKVRYSKGILAKPEVILYKSEGGKKYGDRINFFTLARLAINSVTAATGAVANQSPTLTNTQVVLSTWDEMTVEVIDRTDVQSAVDLIKEFTKQFGERAAERLDAQVTGQAGTLDDTNRFGSQTAPTPIDPLLLTAALDALDQARIPPEDRSWVFRPVAKAQLMRIDQFVDVGKLGLAKSPIITGQFGELYGSRVLISAEITTAGTPVYARNLYFHKDAIALGMSRDLKIEKLARIAKSTRLSADMLYGIGVPQSTHSVVIDTSTTLT